MLTEELKPKMKVRVKCLKPTAGMVALSAYLRARVLGMTGRLINTVPGNGGEVWWVRHDDSVGSIAVYCFTELEPCTGDTLSILDTTTRVVEL